jgi:site-specific DNA recombinase
LRVQQPSARERSPALWILRLTYLAPDITDAILDGRQPLNMSAAVLLNHPSLPLSWPEQRKALDFT